jgi:hypothetical protein
MPPVGLSFAPTQPATTSQGRPTPAAPIMDAIKILSLRVPQGAMGNAPVAPGLLAGAGGAQPSGLSQAALIQQWLQRFFGSGLPGQGQPGGTMPPPGLPTPPSSPGRPSVQLPQTPIPRPPEPPPEPSGPMVPDTRTPY